MYISSPAFHAGVDPFDGFEKVSCKGSFTSLQQETTIALLLLNSMSHDRHK